MGAGRKGIFATLPEDGSFTATTCQTAQLCDLPVVRCTENRCLAIQGAPNPNRKKPRIAGLCGREVVACDHLSLSRAFSIVRNLGGKRNIFGRSGFVASGRGLFQTYLFYLRALGAAVAFDQRRHPYLARHRTGSQPPRHRGDTRPQTSFFSVLSESAHVVFF